MIFLLEKLVNNVKYIVLLDIINKYKKIKYYIRQIYNDRIWKF